MSRYMSSSTWPFMLVIIHSARASIQTIALYKGFPVNLKIHIDYLQSWKDKKKRIFKKIYLFQTTTVSLWFATPTAFKSLGFRLASFKASLMQIYWTRKIKFIIKTENYDLNSNRSKTVTYANILDDCHGIMLYPALMGIDLLMLHLISRDLLTLFVKNNKTSTTHEISRFS